MDREVRNPAFPRMIAKFCRQRASEHLPPREVELLAAYMIDLFDRGRSPPGRGRGLDWPAIADQAGISADGLLGAKADLRPGFDALRRELRKPTGRPRGRPRKPATAPARGDPQPRTAKPRRQVDPNACNRPMPEDLEWIDPVAFSTAFDLHIRRHRDTLSGLVQALALEGCEVPYSTLRMWRLGRKSPSHHASLEVLSRLERRWGLAPRYFAAKLSSQPRAVKGHSIPDASPSERRHLAWHLPHDFNCRSKAEQAEIMAWVQNVVISGTTEYRRFQSNAAKHRFAVRFPGLHGLRPQAREEVDPQGRSGTIGDNTSLGLAIGKVLFGAHAPGFGSDGLDLSAASPARSPPSQFIPAREAFESAGFYDSGRRPAEVGLRLGSDQFGRDVAVPLEDLGRHTYLVGATGVGKSALITAMIEQDVELGRPFVLIDPHGDLYNEVLCRLPPAVAERAYLADAGDFDHPFTLNLLEIGEGREAAIQRSFVGNQLVAVFKRVYGHNPDAFGPMFEAYFRNAIMLLMEVEGPSASLADFDRVFGEPAYRRGLLERCNDEAIVRFWRNIAARASGDAALEAIAPYICSKLTQFTGNPLVRPIVSSRASSLDFPRALEEQRPVLVNLAKGRVGATDAALLGGLVAIRLFVAAMARADLPPGERAPMRVYLDEFQVYASSVIAEMLAESRKFGLELVLANQSLDALNEGDVAQALLANVGSIACFRVGPRDATRIADWFAPQFSQSDLQRLPDRTCVIRALANGAASRPTLVRTRDLAAEAGRPRSVSQAANVPAISQSAPALASKAHESDGERCPF